jgi:[FeFe] hydrogenase H-cluster maturation GTPase HydF
MGLNDTPSGERMRIGFFGVRNAGKSSLVNAVTAQEMSIVDAKLGTTTDPVSKNMELLPLGPVTIIDTPGIDDEGCLGVKRVEKTHKILETCDIAILVTDASRGLSAADKELLQIFKDRQKPYILASNKIDLLSKEEINELEQKENCCLVSATCGTGIYELKECIGKLKDKVCEHERTLVRDFLETGDIVVLVIPIDSSAPKMRIILPQQMVMRDCLDAHAIPVCCQPQELANALDTLQQEPKLVITDSQAFKEVAQIVPESIALTSFSILMARYKGELEVLHNSAQILQQLTDESKVLISEACTHHRQCEDIGTVKIPVMIKECCVANPKFDFTSGKDFPQNLNEYSLIVHCGACMITEKEMHARMEIAKADGIPIVNYGVAIAYMNGILARALEPFDKCSQTQERVH